MFRKPRFNLESFGRLLLTKARIRIFLCFLVLPPILACLFLSYQKNSLDFAELRYATAMRKGKAALERKARKEKFLDRHTRPEPYFLDREIESLSFLENERQRLNTWLSHPAVPDKKGLQQRLLFLQGSENSIGFVEEEIQRTEVCKETFEKQRHPVEMDNRDLVKLLSLIEDLPLENSISTTQRPQLIITNFVLHKIPTRIQNEVFEIKIDLVKREFL